MKLTKLFLFISIFSYSWFFQEVDTYNEYLNKIDNAQTKNDKVKILLSAGEHYMNANPKYAEYFFDQVREIKPLSLENEAKLKQQLTTLYRKQGRYSESVQSGLEAKLLYEKLKDSIGLAKTLISLGVTDRYRKNNEKSIAYYNKAINISLKTKDSLSLGIALNMRGIANRRIGDVDLALKDYELATTIFKTINDGKNLIGVKSNRAIIYSTQKKNHLSLPLFKEYLEFHKEKNNTMSIAIAYYNISNDYIDLKQYKKAIKYADSSFVISKKMGYKFRVAKANYLKADAYEKMGDYISAIKFHKLFNAQKDSIFNIENEKKLKEFELNQKFELERKELKIKSEARRAKNISYIVLLLSLLAFITYATYLIRRNYKGKLKYIATKLERQELKKELLAEKVKASEAELKLLTADNKMRLNYLQQFYKTLQLDLKGDRLEDTRLYIRSLLLKLQIQITTQEKLSKIQGKVEAVNRGFESKLLKEFPSLTKSEREVCGLLRVNLSIKEVASIRNTSIDSIKSIRYRLRKKLGLNKNIELDKFIQDL